MNTLKRLQIARTSLLLDQPFFGVLALQLKLREDDTFPTAWTDGTSIAFNPVFADTLSNDELMGVLAHEVMHCAAGHPWRRNGREMFPWNVAADYAINDILVEAGFKLPAGVLLDPQYKGKWAEWIYARLPPHMKNNKSGKGGYGACTGEVHDASGAPGDATEADWQQSTQQALNAAKAFGKLPASLARQLSDIAKPRVDWASLVLRYAQEIVRADYSWTRPNIRYLQHGLYMPALRSIACGRIAGAIDTSGSIDAITLNQFGAVLEQVVAICQPSLLEVLYCDAKVHRVDTFSRGEHIQLTACGGGGTDFRPVFDHYRTEDPPMCLIYLTDLYGTFPDSAPNYPVIWCSTTDQPVPFGDLCHVQI